MRNIVISLVVGLTIVLGGLFFATGANAWNYCWYDCYPTSPTPTPTPNPCEEEEEYVLYTVQEECPTPEPTLEPEESTPSANTTNNTGCVDNCGPGENHAWQCPDVQVDEFGANFHVLRNGDVAKLNWVPKGGDKVNIYYTNMNDESDKHSLINYPNSGNAEINLLGSKDWKFGIQRGDGCGPIYWIDDATSNEWILFREVYI